MAATVNQPPKKTMLNLGNLPPKVTLAQMAKTTVRPASSFQPASIPLSISVLFNWRDGERALLELATILLVWQSFERNIATSLDVGEGRPAEGQEKTSKDPRPSSWSAIPPSLPCDRAALRPICCSSFVVMPNAPSIALISVSD